MLRIVWAPLRIPRSVDEGEVCVLEAVSVGLVMRLTAYGMIPPLSENSP
jgi:hypothetical protein